MTMTEIAIFQAASGQIDVRLEKDNVWLSLLQLTELFGRDKSVISRHLRNVFADGELDTEAVVAKFATTESRCNSPSAKIFFICLEIVDLFR